MRKTVAIFGGAFDPVHEDHLAIARQVTRRGLADEVWLVPSPDRWDKRLFATAAQRLEMLRLALANDPGCLVSDREIVAGEFRGTYHFLRGLSEQYQDTEFRLVIGADSYASVPKWRDPLLFFGTEFNGVRLMREYALIVFAREGYALPDVHAHAEAGYKPLLCIEAGEGFTGLYSSTAIREALATHSSPVPGLSAEVRAYIEEHALYHA